jgi:hypothetical protein
VAFERIETLDSTLPEQLGREDLAWEAGFWPGSSWSSTSRYRPLLPALTLISP